MHLLLKQERGGGGRTCPFQFSFLWRLAPSPLDKAAVQRAVPSLISYGPTHWATPSVALEVFITHSTETPHALEEGASHTGRYADPPFQRCCYSHRFKARAGLRDEIQGTSAFPTPSGLVGDTRTSDYFKHLLEPWRGSTFQARADGGPPLHFADDVSFCSDSLSLGNVYKTENCVHLYSKGKGYYLLRAGRCRLLLCPGSTHRPAPERLSRQTNGTRPLAPWFSRGVLAMSATQPLVRPRRRSCKAGRTERAGVI